MTGDPAASWRRTAVNLTALAALWELAGQYDLVASGALPAPSEIGKRSLGGGTPCVPQSVAVPEVIWRTTLLM